MCVCEKNYGMHVCTYTHSYTGRKICNTNVSSNVKTNKMSLIIYAKVKLKEAISEISVVHVVNFMLLFVENV